MKHLIGTVLCLLEGGNKYKVISQAPTPGSEFKGCYQLECTDFWCIEDVSDGIMCWKEGGKLWISSFAADCMVVWESVED